MGQILYPNYTESLAGNNSFQIYWSQNAQWCGRPPADWNISIACDTLPGSRVYDNLTRISESYIGGSLLAEYQLFQECCPYGAIDGIPNVYTADLYCPAIWCYTSNETLATGYAECVQRIAADQAKEQGVEKFGNTTLDQFGARCEWIDYDMLKRGVKHSQATPGVASYKNTVLSALVGTLLVAVPIAVGIL